MFGTRNHQSKVTTTTRTRRGFRNPFHRKDPDRVAGGFKAALANPNTTKQGRKEAKRSLQRMGRGNEAHVSFMTKLKRTFGIRSSHRKTRIAGLTSHTTPTRRRFGRKY